MLKGVSGDPCEKWREPSIPGLGNIVLLGQTKNAVHASLPDHESHKVVCVLLAWQYYTNPFAQTGANAFFTAAAADAGSLWGMKGLATVPATSAEKAAAIHPAHMGEEMRRSYATSWESEKII